MSLTAIDPQKMPYGICPLQSGAMAPISGPGIQASPITISPVAVACPGPGCQLFCPETETCCFRSLYQIADCARSLTGIDGSSDSLVMHLADIAKMLDCLEPPKDSPSPLMRIADALDSLVERKRDVTARQGTPG